MILVYHKNTCHLTLIRCANAAITGLIPALFSFKYFFEN